MKFDGGFKKYIMGAKGGLVALLLATVGVLLLLQGGTEKNVRSAELETELAELCSSADGVGECRVMITYGEDGEVFAVAVLCSGAESARVRSEVKELVGSLFGIGANRISVMKLEE